MRRMIERNTQGITRTVFLTKRYALKVPCCRYGWSKFLLGLLANMQERTWGRCGLDGICPVLWADPLGFLVIMPRCEPLSAEQEMSASEYRTFVERDGYIIPAENKPDSFGIYRGEIVAIDYGN